MPAADSSKPRRHRRFRRRLRTRIILSFVLLGSLLSAFIAAATFYVQNRVENRVISDTLVKNNNLYAEGFYRDPNAVGVAFEKIQGRMFSADKVERVPDEWKGLDNGVHELKLKEGEEERVYKLAVRKDPQYWFFLAYDIAEERESQNRLKTALVVLVMILSGADSLRDVLAFPKIQNGMCLMMETPATVQKDQLDLLKIKAGE